MQRNTADDNTLKGIEKKEKLNWAEKKAVKMMIKKGKKVFLSNRYKVMEEKKQRDLLEKEFLQLTKVLDITTDSGEIINKDYVKTLTTKELEESFIEALNEMEKLI